MYLCVLRVRHISPRGEPYTRTHLVSVRTTLHAAVLQCGATPPQGAAASLSRGLPMSEIVYPGGVHPISVDPCHIVLHLEGLTGGLWVNVPYECTYEHLTVQIIPAKLRALGVHPFDVQGALACSDGEPVLTQHLWSGAPPPACMWWTKLGRRVQHAWPRAVQCAVRSMQRSWRQKKEWCVLEQGLEPWTISS